MALFDAIGSIDVEEYSRLTYGAKNAPQAKCSGLRQQVNGTGSADAALILQDVFQVESLYQRNRNAILNTHFCSTFQVCWL